MTTMEDPVFTSWPYFRELRTFFTESKKILVDDGQGGTLTRLDLIVNFSKKFYDNKSGKIDLETAIRNCGEVDCLLRNHYKDAMSEQRATLIWYECMKMFMPLLPNCKDGHVTVADKLAPDLITRLKTQMSAEKVVVLKAKQEKKPKPKAKPKESKDNGKDAKKGRGKGAKAKADAKADKADGKGKVKKRILTKTISRADDDDGVEPAVEQPAKKTKVDPTVAPPPDAQAKKGSKLTKKIDFLDSLNETINKASLPFAAMSQSIDTKPPD